MLFSDLKIGDVFSFCCDHGEGTCIKIESSSLFSYSSRKPVEDIDPNDAVRLIVKNEQEPFSAQERIDALNRTISCVAEAIESVGKAFADTSCTSEEIIKSLVWCIDRVADAAVKVATGDGSAS